MQALDLPPGPRIGELLQRLSEEQAAGEILTRQQALAFAHRWKTQG
jgi:tRNA nucleotidyltransferase (CCA-adding enzyme)